MAESNYSGDFNRVVSNDQRIVKIHERMHTKKHPVHADQDP